ncbi:hypothetical protein SDC9_163480 [bioreactor metagenome]|uniref:Uncharacterized protein n=1 Tax=bioreactor metagenome TaxID=1076179 RepID=A0A645FR99_9ZZZZ
MGHGTYPVQVLFSRHRRPKFLLSHQKNLLVRLHSPAQSGNGDRSLHVEGQIHMGKNRQAPQGQNGNIPGCQLHNRVPFFD